MKSFFLDVDGVLLDTKSTWRSIHEFLRLSKDSRLLKYRRFFFECRITYQKWAEFEASLRKI